MAASAPIELVVNDDHFFRISEIERFEDGSGYVGRVSLRSGTSALHGLSFYFENLGAFLEQTRKLYETLSGAAELRQPWERDHLSVKATGRGHVLVSGHFEFFDGESQELKFAFETDQTYLPAFIRSLEQVHRETDG